MLTTHYARAASIAAAMLLLLASNPRAGWASDTCNPNNDYTKYDCTSPVTSGCNSSAITACSKTIKSSAGSVLGTVQLRYSTKCQTAWTKTVSNVGKVSITSHIERFKPTNNWGVSSADAVNTATSNYTLQFNDGAGFDAQASGWIKGRTAQTCSY